MKKLSIYFSVVTLGTACSFQDLANFAGDQIGFSDGEVNESNTQTTAKSSISAAEQATGSDNGETAANEFLAVGFASFGTASPGSGGALTRVESQSAAMTSGVCDCDEDSCTFTDCSSTEDDSTFTMNGTLSWTTSTVVGDITYKGENGSGAFDISVKMDLNTTESSIDGFIETKGKITSSAAGVEVGSEWESRMDYTELNYNASKCFTSGSLKVSTDVSKPAAYSAESDVTYDGSDC